MVYNNPARRDGYICIYLKARILEPLLELLKFSLYTLANSMHTVGR